MKDNQQYLQMFLDESVEYLQLLNENILILEREPNNEEAINTVFRAAHSIKGMAGVMGYNNLMNLTHKIENILSKIRNNEITINGEVIDALFNGIDIIKELVDNIKTNNNENVEIDVYLKNLNLILNEDMEAEENKNKIGLIEKKEKVFEKMKTGDVLYDIKVILKKDCVLKGVRGYMVLKKAEELGFLLESNPSKEDVENDNFDKMLKLKLISRLPEDEIMFDFQNITDVEKVEIEIIKKIENQAQKRKNSETQKKVEQKKKEKNNKKKISKVQTSPTIRVDINKLDHLMNMVGELLISKTRLDSLNINNNVYQDIIQQLERVTTDLHHTVMKIRMIPIGGLFNRFPRMVRDLSKELEKEIELVIEGSETELDRSIIDELADPLMHILRNSIDHGVEKPEIREKKGKSRTGTILLKAYQKGNEIIIEIEDDGNGLNIDRIIEKAIDNNVASKEEIEKMEKDEVWNLIFNPGFSTSEKVTDVSGRGVGMDVVKRSIESLDGQIFIETEKGLGTKFTLSLPLTLAITQALMVKIHGEIYAIPLSTIKEAYLISSKEILKVRGQDVIVLREKTIPLVETAKRLNLNIKYGKYKSLDEVPIVIISFGEKDFALIVDELLNQQDIVIKSLGDYLGNVKNISGATIIGDGDIALILDVRSMI